MSVSGPGGDGAIRPLSIIGRMICLIGVLIMAVSTGGIVRVAIIAFLLYVIWDLVGPLIDVLRRQKKEK